MWLGTALFTLGLLCVAGCGDTGGPRKDDEGNMLPSEPVCDGTTRLRLRFFMPGQPARSLPGQGVQIENGHPSFALDGQCSYWIDAGWFNGEPDVDAKDLGWRTGPVDAELEADLNTLPLEHLDTLGDCKPNTIFDGSPLVISDGISGAGCVDSGPRHLAAWDMVRLRAVDLWARGSPMAGGLWLSAVPLRSGDTSKAYPWPVSEPLKSFMIPATAVAQVGLGRLVQDLTAAAELRALKAQYIQDRQATPGYFSDGQKMSDGTSEALVYARDQLPYEDEHGLLPLGIPPGIPQ